MAKRKNEPNGLGGKPYRQIVARHVAKTFGQYGIDVYEEVAWGSSIIGKNRKVDLLVVSKKDRTAVALQAKYQTTTGTADEKIPYALADCEAMWIPAAVVFGGNGWSVGVQHLLQGSRHAVALEVDGQGRVSDSSELDAFLAQHFRVWEVALKGKKPVVE
jgi:hypothetical protein